MGSSTSTAWVGGRILTGRRRVEALLAEAGRIVVAGSAEEVRRHRSTGTETVDLAGRGVVPGLIDAHLHLGLSVLYRSAADLRRCESPSEVVDALRAAAERYPRGPVFGLGWDESRFPGALGPLRTDLDRVSRDRPVIAYRHSLHLASVNSATLDRLRSSEPGAAGNPRRRKAAENGLLAESALRGLKPLEDEALASRGPEVRAWLEEAASYGLTTVAPMSSSPEELAAVGASREVEPLSVRLGAFLRVPDPVRGPWWGDAPNGGDIRIAGLKVHADGALGPRTAWLRTPYDDAPGTRGDSTASPDRLRAIGQLAERVGIGLAVHAIGDAALLEVLGATRERREPRLRVEHASMTPPDAWSELTRVQPVVVVQPGFRQTDGWLRERLGEGRARWTYAYRSLLGLGLTMAGSSDAPVENLDPWSGMHASTVPRVAAPPGEELTAAQALTLYTSGGAAALNDPSIGHLGPGASADLVVLGTDSLESALRAGSRSVRATYRAGRCTFARA